MNSRANFVKGCLALAVLLAMPVDASQDRVFYCVAESYFLASPGQKILAGDRQGMKSTVRVGADMRVDVSGGDIQVYQITSRDNPIVAQAKNPIISSLWGLDTWVIHSRKDGSISYLFTSQKHNAAIIGNRGSCSEF